MSGEMDALKAAEAALEQAKAAIVAAEHIGEVAPTEPAKSGTSSAYLGFTDGPAVKGMDF